MDFKVSILCKDCDCSFELTKTSTVQTEPIACPNCFQPISPSDCKALRQSISSLVDFPSFFQGLTLSDGQVRNGYKITVLFCHPTENKSCP